MFSALKLAFERLPLYISYFLKKVDDHSLQAPFAYAFYRLLKRAGDSEIPRIEEARRQLLNSTAEISYFTFGKQSSLNPSQKSKVSAIAKLGISDRLSSQKLSAIIRKFNCEIIIELGTSLGINTCYLAEANPNGKVFTFEGHPELCHFSRKLFNELEYKNIEQIEGDIKKTFPAFLKRIDQVDFLYIDANHSSAALLDYFRLIDTKISEHTIVVIDDIRWSRDMYFGWKVIRKFPRVSHSFDAGNTGYLFFKKGFSKQHYVI